MADSRRTRGVHKSPKPMVNSATPAIGMKTSLDIPNVRKGFPPHKGIEPLGIGKLLAAVFTDEPIIGIRKKSEAGRRPRGLAASIGVKSPERKSFLHVCQNNLFLVRVHKNDAVLIWPSLFRPFLSQYGIRWIGLGLLPGLNERRGVLQRAAQRDFRSLRPNN